ncbi:DUF5686 family protein [Winogradskyella thalassocola]|uniref:CarboxypepD_reg-like domain-containing protein n=1 Tax=Winogradskyella thalassocola TaxID=262004 RepID=A0A1G7VJD9_9FLAO|nr:DUF5686 family protein [Winogradskyella thalassocola]SDG59519.1 CarboxypepD_reg-like domain-containing protein [Winogradskyella thalassocola]
MKKALALLIVILTFNTYAQSLKKFKLIDEDSGIVIPFANIIFNDTSYKGTATDIDGVFFVNADIKKITISYVSYETKILEIANIKSETITLKQAVSELDEVVIDRENPAHRIIRLAVANKDLNNPENLNSFTYKSYDKVYVDINENQDLNDSLSEDTSFFKDSYFFITETIAKHKYLKPRFTEDSVIARRTSGFKNPNFAVLANSFQPFSFYDDHISLFETDYLNPISKGSTKKYKFRLKDEYVKGQDTVFVISFEPKANRNFEGLEGLLYINSNQYAVESVDASTYNSGKIDFTIQQKYKFIDNDYWFPEQLNFVIILGEGFGSFKYVGKSYLSEITTNTPLKKKDFPLVSLTLSEDVEGRHSQYWDQFRKDTLDAKERRTYVLIDSIGDKMKLDKFLKWAPSLVKWRIPFKYVDLDLKSLATYNKYEGARLGLGLYTNDDIFKHLSIGGYGAYGFKDHTWKYGGEVSVDVPGDKDISVSLKYKNDLRETGTYSGNTIDNPFVQRNWIASQMDAIESFSIHTEMKLLRNMNWDLGFNTADVTPLYDYQFMKNGLPMTKYTNSEINVGIGYHVNEELVRNFGVTTRLPSDAPVFKLMYSRGLKGAFDSDFSYNKLRFTLDHSFITKGLGKTTYRLDLGYIDSALPYGLLFTGEGTLDKKIPFVVKDYFQTVTPYEFLSDRYANVFTTHNFGRLFNNKGLFQPDVLLYNNLGIGSLDHTSYHQNIEFKTKDELFLETGLELQNIIKIPYLNIGYLGIGVGAFYRYGYHNLDKSSDNFAFKYSVGFTFK